MADGRHIENGFSAISRRHIGGNKEFIANTSQVTKTATLENSSWLTAAILKIALSAYFSR